ncbi:emerin (Emery-Dreifuss muscular dystrophy) [Hoplias malabaricus]|uniref:emerin (Emery-Dreifuss muscular dystrophy) n=1 Tax=Hoplias malabaricus TaxID=27720 RepID=UPI00346371D3
MSSLSIKSAEEIARLLDEYGIKHGPIVDSTRKLYEKKLSEAMVKGKQPSSSASSSDKTYYREEQEEITYVTYRPAVRHEGLGDITRRSRITDYDDIDNADEPIISHTQANFQSTSRSRPTAYTSRYSQQEISPAPSKSEGSKSGGVPGWLRILVFIIIAAFLYYVYSNMETTDQSPFGKIDA